MVREVGEVTRGDYRLLIGDCRETLASLPKHSVHVCVTSPPYWGLRSYDTGAGKHAEIGGEPRPEAFISTMVEVFRAVRRVLRPDGSLWINLGDGYATGAGGCTTPGSDARVGKPGYLDAGHTPANRTRLAGYKTGDLLNMPHRVAAALQGDGWYWRSTVIWAKRSQMPESVGGVRWERCRVKVKPHQARTRDMSNGAYIGSAEWADCPGCSKCEASGGYVLRRGRWRPTNSHEYLFLMTPSEKYFADELACAEAAIGASPGNKSHKGADAYLLGDEKMRTKLGLKSMVAAESRNPRGVWTLSSEPYRGAHFAAFPTELVRRCLLPFLSPGGVCAACGSQYAPVLVRGRVSTRPAKSAKHDETGNANRDPERHVAFKRADGYRPTCQCGVSETGRPVVLDPFAGSGTTIQVAVAMGADAIGCELSEAYAEQARQRIKTVPRCLVQKKTKKKRRAVVARQREMFDSGETQ